MFFRLFFRLSAHFRPHSGAIFHRNTPHNFFAHYQHTINDDVSKKITTFSGKSFRSELRSPDNTSRLQPCLNHGFKGWNSTGRGHTYLVYGKRTHKFSQAYNFTTPFQALFAKTNFRIFWAFDEHTMSCTCACVWCSVNFHPPCFLTNWRHLRKLVADENLCVYRIWEVHFRVHCSFYNNDYNESEWQKGDHHLQHATFFQFQTVMLRSLTHLFSLAILTPHHMHMECFSAQNTEMIKTFGVIFFFAVWPLMSLLPVLSHTLQLPRAGEREPRQLGSNPFRLEVLHMNSRGSQLRGICLRGAQAVLDRWTGVWVQDMKWPLWLDSCPMVDFDKLHHRAEVPACWTAHPHLPGLDLLSLMIREHEQHLSHQFSSYSAHSERQCCDCLLSWWWREIAWSTLCRHADVPV